MVAPGGAIQSLMEQGWEGDLLCVTGAGDNAHAFHGQCIFMLQALSVPLVGNIFKSGGVGIMMLATPSHMAWKEKYPSKVWCMEK